MILNEGPAEQPWVIIQYIVSGNAEYLCWAAPQQPTAQALPTISSATKANPCVLTITAHKLPVGSRANITISGVTGTGWTALNTTLVATYVDANSVSVAVDSSGFGTLGGTIVVSTTYPTTDRACWQIKHFSYDAAANQIHSGYANLDTKWNKSPDNRATYSY